MSDPASDKCIPGCGHPLPCPHHPAVGVATMDPDQCADGATYAHAQDHGRLAAQRWRVWVAIVDGDWHTLAELGAATGDPEASVSARLRDFRKVKFGGHTIERSRIGPGTFAYRLKVTR